MAELTAPQAQVGSGILAIGGQVLANHYQKKFNQQQIDFQNAMYDRQNQDEQRMFDRNNAYNHPTQQMNRLRQAGLNPNLVYGKGAETTASTGQRAPSPGGGFTGSPQRFDVSQVGDQMLKYYQIKQMQAQTDNVHQATALSRTEQQQKLVQIANIAQQTAGSEFQLQMAKELKDTTLQRASLETKKLGQGIELEAGRFGIDQQRLQLEKARSAADLTKIGEEVLSIKANRLKTQADTSLVGSQRSEIQARINEINAHIQMMSTQNAINELDRQLKEKGIQPNDPAALRWLMRRSSEPDTAFTNNYKRITYGGRPGFDKDGNKQSLYKQLTK